MIASLALRLATAGGPLQCLPRADISLAAGESVMIACTITDTAGADVALSGRNLYYVVRARGVATPLIYRRLSIVADGSATLTLDTADTLTLGGQYGTEYSAEFWLVDDGGFQAPIADLSVLRIGPQQGLPSGTPTNPTSEAITLTIRGLAVFAAADTVTVTYSGGATFAAPVIPEIGAPYLSVDDGDISVDIIAYTTTGFTLRASGAFSGSVPYTAIGASA